MDGIHSTSNQEQDLDEQQSQRPDATVTTTISDRSHDLYSRRQLLGGSYIAPLTAVGTATESVVGRSKLSRLDLIEQKGESHQPLSPGGPSGNAHPYSIARQSLPVIDGLASQIITCFTASSLSEIQALTSGDENEGSQSYRVRRDLFIQTRRVFARDHLFITQDDVPSLSPPEQEIIRKVNRTTALLSIFENSKLFLFEVDRNFLHNFVPFGQKLLIWQGGIFLELKTQAYIFALLQNNGSVDLLLDQLFPSDLGDRLKARHPDSPILTQSEADFVDRAHARKQYLQAEPATTLSVRYAWNDFVREFALSVARNSDSLLNSPVGNLPSAQYARVTAPTASQRSSGDVRETIDHGVRQLLTLSNAFPHRKLPLPIKSPGSSSIHSLLDVKESHDTAHISPKTDSTPASAISRSPQDEPASRDWFASASSSFPRSNPRHAWTMAEEQALLAGLERLGGPFWSQILSLYGRGGSVSEVLKDRNQIQLKDKARNLKLWYLKSSNGDPNAVPSCLRAVTGELKKRSGGDKSRAGADVPTESPSSSMYTTPAETALRVTETYTTRTSVRSDVMVAQAGSLARDDEFSHARDEDYQSQERRMKRRRDGDDDGERDIELSNRPFDGGKRDLKRD